ncbi:MAG: DUF998 domain-containing protein [Bacteroidetes bacterium]|nr:DUF998 domain-containing protein [Bacteroidota bacterium]
MNTAKNNLVISYLTLRKAIGILGILLPLTLAIGSVIFGDCLTIQQSISNYYHTNMRDVFVGYMCVISVFLIAYKGYDTLDNLASTLAGTFGLILALLPTAIKIDPLGNPLYCNILCNTSLPGWIGIVHLISAGLFFITLACISMFLFTKGYYYPTPEKLLRNKIYRTCAIIMFACMAALALFFALPLNFQSQLLPYKPVLILETFALLAFGLSWLVKGEAILRD